MRQQIIIAEQMRIAALLKEENIEELIVAKGRYQIGDVYLGTVENVLPGIDAAFVNIGESEKNGFIHVSDLGPLRLKKTSAGITELLEPRQKVLVQVIKEPTGNKGARLSGNLALPGRYLVLQPHGQGVNISRRINSESERNRLKAVGILIKPPGTGLLIRTEAEKVDEELLIEDLEYLLKQWEIIQQTSEHYSPPSLIKRDEDFIQKVLRDHISSEVSKIIVDSQQAVERVQDFLNNQVSNLSIEAHQGPSDIFQHYKINLAIQNALQPRVDLPSGGYIIIEPTEALTVIDVNSGSFTRSANARETVLWTNCEAAKEIARQLRLRNIGGVIIIDFIDMDSRKDQLQLLEDFSSAIKNDSARPQIAQLTELGLVELTRKRQGQNIYELFGKVCPDCFGLGNIPELPDSENYLETTSKVNSASDKTDQNIKITNEPQINLDFSNKNNEKINLNHDDNITDNNIQNNIVSSGTIDTTSDLQKNKLKTELITVKLNEVEEEVYRNLGFSPKLLLDESQSNENSIICILREGDDSEEVIKQAKQLISSNTNRHRKKNRFSIKNSSKSNLATSTLDNEQIEIEEIDTEQEIKPLVENIPINDDKEDLKNEEVSSSIEDQDDPRRKRRRSSAVN